MFFKDLDEILKNIVALANVSGGEILIENYDLQNLETEIKDRIINIPEYWFKNKGDAYILNVKSNLDDSFLKIETEFGYEFLRFIVKDNEIIPATKEMRENTLISEKYLLVKCNSFIGLDEVIDTREIKNKVSEIKDDLILFVKRNLLYSKEKLWNISPEVVENAINKALYEYSYENNFPIELSIYSSKKLQIKYFLGNKKDRRFVEDIIVKDEYLFGNKIRVLTLLDRDAPKKETYHISSEKAISQLSDSPKPTNSSKDTSISSVQAELNAQIYHVSKENTPKKSSKFEVLLEFTKTARTSKEIMAALGLKDRETFYNNYLKPAIKDGYVEYTIPEKPRSPKQKYIRTQKAVKL